MTGYYVDQEGVGCGEAATNPLLYKKP